MRLIKDIETENKDIKTVVAVVEQVYVEKRVKVKIYYSH